MKAINYIGESLFEDIKSKFRVSNTDKQLPIYEKIYTIKSEKGKNFVLVCTYIKIRTVREQLFFSLRRKNIEMQEREVMYKEEQLSQCFILPFVN
uniref:Uncharacterized protein n=1 Tax=Timema poppense TaxID=170557 RepID=A0A7R9CVH9_TIMPO|nr:unnamed protein product [Timema poppensis]